MYAGAGHPLQGGGGAAAGGAQLSARLAMERAGLAEFPDGPDGRLFYGVRSSSMPSTTYMQAWREARRAALTPHVSEVPARRPST